jgi:hypothetical protein
MLKPSVEARANQETLKALTPDDDTLLPSVAHRFETTTTTTRGYMIETKSSFSLAFQIENYLWVKARQRPATRGHQRGQTHGA